MGTVRVERFSGDVLEGYIPLLADLRIEVFREFPYLYDGSRDYEAAYLQTYRRCDQAVVVIAFDGEQVVGASTAIPMRFEEEAFRAPFEAAGYDPARVFYLAESVLRREYRGRGLGVRFFKEREAHALALGGFDWCTFCAVVREPDHPLGPPDYQPLDGFWRRRGYEKQPALHTRYRWKDVDQPDETFKRMEFWVKSLT